MKDDISKIILRDYSVRPIRKGLKYHGRVVGFDTETHEGRVSLIADGEGRYRIIRGIKEIFNFFKTGKYYKCINFFFNLEYDTNAILAYLPKSNLYEIAETNSTTFEDYFISIIPRKNLKISWRESGVMRTLNFFDIYQFYQFGNLEKTYAKVFNKPYVKTVDASKADFHPDRLEFSSILYCQSDAKACQDLAKLFVESANKMCPIRKFYSNASLGKALRRFHMKEDYVFTPEMANMKINGMALKSFGGGRIEVLKKGYFKEIYLYDVISAYPSIQVGLRGFGNEWVSGAEYYPDSLHSFYTVNVNVGDCFVSPIKHKFKNLVCYPTGSFQNVHMSKSELEVLIDYGIDHKIIEGWHNMGKPDEDYPFDYFRDVFNQRKRYKEEGSLLQLPLKLALNSSYGITIERQDMWELYKGYKINEKKIKDAEQFDNLIYYGGSFYGFPDYTEDDYRLAHVNDDYKFSTVKSRAGSEYQIILRRRYRAGQFFNPIWASEITSGIRSKIYRDCINYENNVIKFSTDSISFDRPVKLDFGSNLGQYEPTKKYEAVIVGNGVYSLRDDDRVITKFRGFGISGGNDMFQICENNKYSNKYSYVKKSPLKLKESMRNDFKDFNVFVDKEKFFCVDFDRKRLWDSIPECFGDLLDGVIDSRPITENDFYALWHSGSYYREWDEYNNSVFAYDRAFDDSTLCPGERVDLYSNIR